MENEQNEISPVDVAADAQEESQTVKSQEKSHGKLALICLVTSIAGGMIGLGIFQPSMMAVLGVALLAFCYAQLKPLVRFPLAVVLLTAVVGAAVLTGLVILALASALSAGRW